ncbi:hypothetical protein BsWGS_09684 [Bradybaena similaris]
MDNTDVASRHSANRHPYPKRLSFLKHSLIWAMKHYGQADQIEFADCYKALIETTHLCTDCLSEVDFYRDILKLFKNGKLEVIIGQQGEFIIERHQETFIKRLLWKGCGVLIKTCSSCLDAVDGAIELLVDLIVGNPTENYNYNVGLP